MQAFSMDERNYIPLVNELGLMYQGENEKKNEEEKKEKRGAKLLGTSCLSL